MKKSLTTALIAAWAFGVPGLAPAKDDPVCGDHTLKGQYVFSASGYTRANLASPWVPKAIIEILQMNGDGTLTTPSVTVANPFGDTGLIVDRVGSPGTYSLNDDCTGSVQFIDGTAFRIDVAPGGDEFWLIQTVGLQGSLNVLQGNAKRIRGGPKH